MITAAADPPVHLFLGCETFITLKVADFWAPAARLWFRLSQFDLRITTMLRNADSDAAFSGAIQRQLEVIGF